MYGIKPSHVLQSTREESRKAKRATLPRILPWPKSDPSTQSLWGPLSHREFSPPPAFGQTLLQASLALSGARLEGWQFHLHSCLSSDSNEGWPCAAVSTHYRHLSHPPTVIWASVAGWVHLLVLVTHWQHKPPSLHNESLCLANWDPSSPFELLTDALCKCHHSWKKLHSVNHSLDSALRMGYGCHLSPHDWKPAGTLRSLPTSSTEAQQRCLVHSTSIPHSPQPRDWPNKIRLLAGKTKPLKNYRMLLEGVRDYRHFGVLRSCNSILKKQPMAPFCQCKHKDISVSGGTNTWKRNRGCCSVSSYRYVEQLWDHHILLNSSKLPSVFWFLCPTSTKSLNGAHFLHLY